MGQEIFDVDFKHFGFDPKTGQDLDGLVFDPKTKKLEISSASNAFSYICTHKRLKRPGTKCPGQVAECSDRGYCYHGYCQCGEGFSGLMCLPSKKFEQKLKIEFFLNFFRQIKVVNIQTVQNCCILTNFF